MAEEIVINVVEDNDLKPSRSSKNAKKTSPVVTKFEYTTLVWYRALHIACGEKPKVDADGMVAPIDIAMKELQERKMPLVIKRELPNGEIEYWDPNKMSLLNH